MNRSIRIVLFIYILLLTPSAYSGSTQREPLPYYFDQEEWTKILANGDTAIIAISKNIQIHVKIKTHTIDIGEFDPKGAFVKHRTNQSCTYTRYPCSIVDNIDISINGKQLLFPSSLYCDLADLNRGKLFIEKNNLVLILEGGDASAGYIVKIDFDHEHVLRKIIYADPSLSADVVLQETIYPHRLGKNSDTRPNSRK